MHFYQFCREIALVTYEDLMGLFSPPPQKKKVLKKKWTIFKYIFNEFLLSLSYF